MTDPSETWLEKWMIHEAMEVWTYWSCLQDDGLVPNAVYHFRVTASNTAGTTSGDDESFTTPAVPPTTTAVAATEIGPFCIDDGLMSTTDVCLDARCQHVPTEEATGTAAAVGCGCGTGSFAPSGGLLVLLGAASLIRRPRRIESDGDHR